jgi:hypothetical protein
MLIGLRLILLLGIFLVGVPLLGWVLTRNARLYRFALTSAKVLGVLLAAMACLWLGERLIVLL